MPCVFMSFVFQSNATIVSLACLAVAIALDVSSCVLHLCQH